MKSPQFEGLFNVRFYWRRFIHLYAAFSYICRCPAQCRSHLCFFVQPDCGNAASQTRIDRGGIFYGPLRSDDCPYFICWSPKGGFYCKMAVREHMEYGLAFHLGHPSMSCHSHPLYTVQSESAESSWDEWICADRLRCLSWKRKGGPAADSGCACSSSCLCHRRYRLRRAHGSAHCKSSGLTSKSALPAGSDSDRRLAAASGRYHREKHHWTRRDTCGDYDCFNRGSLFYVFADEEVGEKAHIIVKAEDVFSFFVCLIIFKSLAQRRLEHNISPNCEI